jgi:hypothetical protein
MAQITPLTPMKAAPLDDPEAFFAGKVPWRLLAIPFDGPIPSPNSPRGVDLDGEWFSPNTDIFGGHKALLENRERATDFHHSSDPTGMMGRTVVGKSILDPNPEEDGWWVDFWVKAGEKRVALIKKLAERGTQLFGSSQASRKVTTSKGEITVWPYYMQTISTSPQNTLSVLRPKAVLDEITQSGIAISTAMTRLIEESADLEADLARATASAKAGRELSGSNEAEIEAAIEEYESGQARMRALLNRIRDKYRKEPDV